MPIIDRLTSEERAALERWNRHDKATSRNESTYAMGYDCPINDAYILATALSRLASEDVK
jgi:hypothetical protein